MTTYASLHVMLPKQLHTDLKQAAKKNHVSITDFVKVALESAVKGHMPPESRLLREIRTLKRCTEMVNQTVLFVARVCMAYTPELSPEERELAHRRGERKFKSFEAALKKHLESLDWHFKEVKHEDTSHVATS